MSFKTSLLFSCLLLTTAGCVNSPKKVYESQSINQELDLLIDAIPKEDLESEKSVEVALKKQLGELDTRFTRGNQQTIQEQNDDSVKSRASENQSDSNKRDNEEIATYLLILMSAGSGFIGGIASIYSALLFDEKGGKSKTKKKSIQKVQIKDSDYLESIINPLALDVSSIKRKLEGLEENERISGKRFFKMGLQIQDLEQQLSKSNQINSIHSSPSRLAQENISVPLDPSKIDLISALNKGDKQLLREVAFSQLNITSESKNAIAIGDAIRTELEEVSGGGSYLSVRLQGQIWLFPTERSLKSFNASQKCKGIFDYDQQTTLSSPQLLEPALLEATGDSWTVKQIGRIAIP